MKGFHTVVVNIRIMDKVKWDSVLYLLKIEIQLNDYD